MMTFINGRVSPDYFAIVMSWDWADAPSLAVLQGMIEGAPVGFAFALFLSIVVAASTRMRCAIGPALRALAAALGIVVTAWMIGGVIGVTLSIIWPRLWGFFFIGVPPRVNLQRFAWVGGSIWGAYGGAAIGLIVASVMLHRQWRRTHGTPRAFAIVIEPLPPPPLRPVNRV
jgi:hypothetical protein